MKLFNLADSEIRFLQQGMALNASAFREFGASYNCQHCESVCASGCGANCSGGCGGRGRA
jgi:hypothetical protein